MNDILSDIVCLLNITTYKSLLLVSHQYNKAIQRVSITKMCNPLVTLMNTFPNKEWDYKMLSHNPNISLDYIYKHPNKNWILNASRSSVTCITVITMKTILKRPEINWSWYYISTVISLEDISNYPDKPWNWSGVSLNHNLTLDFILSNPNKPWDFRQMSQNTFGF